MGEISLLHQWALWYAQNGYHVFPCHTMVAGQCSCGKIDCPDAGKHPRTRYGLTDATTNENQINAWWTYCPEANIGIATGASNLAVIDIDVKSGGEESFEALREDVGREYFETVTALTGGGGQHLLFRASGDIKTGVAVLGAGVDIRAAGGYIIAPPSLHKSGNLYLWEEEYGIDQHDILPFPVVLLPRLAKKSVVALSSADTELIPAGTRNAALASLAGTLRRRGLGADEMLATLRVVNERRCRPALDDNDVCTIANSIARYHPETPLSKMAVAPPVAQFSAPEDIGIALLRQWANPIIDRRRFSTGIPDLDNVTKLLRPGEMTVLGAWTGVGKSGLTTQIALEVGRQHKVLFFPLELMVVKTQHRMLAQLVRADEQWIDYLHESDRLSELYPAMEDMQSRQIKMFAPEFGQAFAYEDIKNMIIAEKPDFVIIDHLQHIDDWTPSASKRSDLNAAAIVRAIRQLAYSEGFHCFLVAQLKGEKIKKSQRPEIYDFADTAALPRVADNVWALHRPFRGFPAKDLIMEILVLKNRRGPEPWIHTHFVPKSMAMFPMSKEESLNALCCTERRSA